jgi:hypothetical protein
MKDTQIAGYKASHCRNGEFDIRRFSVRSGGGSRITMSFPIYLEVLS